MWELNVTKRASDSSGLIPVIVVGVILINSFFGKKIFNKVVK